MELTPGPLNFAQTGSAASMNEKTEAVLAGLLSHALTLSPSIVLRINADFDNILSIHHPAPFDMGYRCC
jgi:hypothetical protein